MASKGGKKPRTPAQQAADQAMEHKPTPATRKLVRALAQRAITQKKIALRLGIANKTVLEKHYRKELDEGYLATEVNIASGLLRTALNAKHPKSVTASIWWEKSRYGYKDRVVTEHTGPGGGPIPVAGPVGGAVIMLPDNGRDPALKKPTARVPNAPKQAPR